MADSHALAQPAAPLAPVTHAPATLAPVTEDAFIADREKFWHSFGSLIKGSVAVMVVLLLALAVFVA